MKHGKKTLSALLTLSVFCGLLSGCAGSGGSASSAAGAPTSEPASEASSTAPSSEAGGEPVTLEFAFWAGAGPEEDAYNTLIDRFMEENPNIKIEKQMLSYADYYTSLDTRIAGGQAPDVCKMLYQQAGTYVDAGILGDMSPYIDQSEVDDLLPAFKAAAVVDGKLVAFPLQTDTYLIFYNKDMFQKSQITPPTTMEEAWSWEEFDDIAKKVKEDNGVKYSFVYRWTKTKSYALFPWIYANGGSVVNADYTRGNLSDPKCLEVLDMIDGWVGDGLLAPISPESSEGVDDIFSTGQAAMIISGNWMMSQYDQNLKGKWGVTYMPQRDGKIGSDLGGGELCITSAGEHPAQAAKFVQFMTSKESSRYFCENANFLPVRTSLSEEGITYQTYSDEMNYFVKQAGTMDPAMVACQTSKGFSKVSKLFSETIERVVLEDTPTATIAADFDAAVEEALAE
ncbi:ABC transporter substrate-binding protein [Harryflintia acetispora]|uniref:ABC transporter substrate-binding protein n=1 Tax=Harryflintia acetispora TaxID=1849041 RepID=UPI00189712F1|nr:sugar ABC transporter substrate-binding protein [Harryflintia acetispora]